MSRLLRFLALLLFVSGTALCAFSISEMIGDEAYRRASLSLARHPGHMFYQAEYLVARIRHLSLLATAVGSGLVVIIIPVLFAALAKLLDRGGLEGMKRSTKAKEDDD